MSDRTSSSDVRYRYNGPLTGLTIHADEARGQEQYEFMLHDGVELVLPSDHPQVVTLVALGRLVSVPPTVPAASPKSTKEPK